jgi:hypothetical protein
MEIQTELNASSSPYLALSFMADSEWCRGAAFKSDLAFSLPPGGPATGARRGDGNPEIGPIDLENERI